MTNLSRSKQVMLGCHRLLKFIAGAEQTWYCLFLQNLDSSICWLDRIFFSDTQLLCWTSFVCPLCIIYYKLETSHLFSSQNSFYEVRHSEFSLPVCLSSQLLINEIVFCKACHISKVNYADTWKYFREKIFDWASARFTAHKKSRFSMVCNIYSINVNIPIMTQICFSDHCMIQFIKPNLLGTKKEFMNRFANPIEQGQCVEAMPRDVRRMKRRAHILHNLLEGCVQVRD